MFFVSLSFKKQIFLLNKCLEYCNANIERKDDFSNLLNLISIKLSRNQDIFNAFIIPVEQFYNLEIGVIANEKDYFYKYKKKLFEYLNFLKNLKFHSYKNHSLSNIKSIINILNKKYNTKIILKEDITLPSQKEISYFKENVDTLILYDYNKILKV